MSKKRFCKDGEFGVLRFYKDRKYESSNTVFSLYQIPLMAFQILYQKDLLFSSDLFLFDINIVSESTMCIFLLKVIILVTFSSRNRQLYPILKRNYKFHHVRGN